jgi:beta-lactamase regulating signal transducer with metallopeptidase domain
MNFEWMNHWLPSLCISSAMLACFWLILRKAIGRQLPYGLMVAAGWVVIARFFVPAPFSHGWGLDRFWTRWDSAVVEDGSWLVAVVPSAGTSGAAAWTQTVASPGGTMGEKAMTSATGTADWGFWIALIWVAGVVVSAIKLSWALRRLRHSVRAAASEQVPNHWHRLMNECRNERHRKHAPRLVLSPDFKVPFACGLLRPVICLPSTMVEFSDAEVRHVLAHESMHLEKGDIAQNLILECLKCLMWFHPFFGSACRALIADRELLRDRQVLRRLGQEAAPEGYASTLLRLATTRHPNLSQAGMVPFFRNPHETARRMKMILTPTRRSFRLTLPSVATLTVVAAATLATSQTPPESSTPQPLAPAVATQDQVVVEVPVSQAKAIDSLNAVLGQPLVRSMNIQKAGLQAVFSAAAAPMQSAAKAPEGDMWRLERQPLEGAHAPAVLRGNFPPIMLWGPYEELPAGRFIVIYRFMVLSQPQDSSTLFFDVCHDACTRSGIRVAASEFPVNEWREVAVPVDLPEPKKLEFRFWPDGADIALDRIYVFRATSSGEIPSDPADASLPPGILVPDNKQVLLSPHLTDSGQIDVSGLASGTKVRCPYTGKYFRVP